MLSLQPVIILLAALSDAPEKCIAVDGPTILAADLVAALPDLKAVERTTHFGYAPDFGMHRNLTARQINAVLRRQRGNRVEVHRPVCVVRRAREITEADVRVAIEKTFAGRQVSIVIEDFARRQVGPGELNFPLQSLAAGKDPATPVVWRGWYRDPEGRRTPVWTKVRLSEDVPVVVAINDLIPGALLDASMFVITSRSHFPPVIAQGTPRPADFVGRSVRWAIRRGETIRTGALEAPVAIRRGDSVTVELTINAAKLQFEGTAETAARTGQTFAVSCPFSKRVLQARAVEKGKAIVPIPSTSRPQVQ